jgi:hypothetical protein
MIKSLVVSKKIRTFAADNKCSTNYVAYEENTTIVIAFSNSVQFVRR